MSRIRPPRADELQRLREIEVAAGAAFVEVGLPEVAGDEPPPVTTLEGYRAAGRAFVLTDEGDRPVAYLLLDLLDGAAHVEQVSVDPAHAGRGLGRRLLDHGAAWAAERGLPAVTLTAFRDVPWNAPYYERCGFRALDPAELGPELAARRREEAAHGLDPDQRVAMVRVLPGRPGVVGSAPCSSA